MRHGSATVFLCIDCLDDCSGKSYAALSELCKLRMFVRVTLLGLRVFAQSGGILRGQSL
jgi:hypothetical protein